MAQPSLEKPKTQLLGNACETAQHHLNPSSGTAKKKVPAAGPKRHLWNPLRRRKEPQYIDKKHGAAEPGEAENAAPRQRVRNSQTPPKTELRHSKEQDLRRGQNGTFGTP